ncbi:TPA: hypothetical protein JG914_004545 [Enterobacter hormaechei subsp. steigerwaltii]|nr:hypothetical protein [Enterobacter hormaechei subsp. steigerwaltii]
MTQSVGSTEVNIISLQFSDGRPVVYGIERVNEILHSIGARASTVIIPNSARETLQVSEMRALTKDEQIFLVSEFHLHRGQLLELVALAGRQPQMYRGGFLSIAQQGTAPYPKVYDLQGMTPEMRDHALTRFSRLHTNSAKDGTGVDEVMTFVSGGPFTHFFALPDGAVARVNMAAITTDSDAIRLSYNGLTPHAALMNARHGLIVAFAHGPEVFDMVFDDPSLPNSAVMDTNPWLDYTRPIPALRDSV